MPKWLVWVHDPCPEGGWHVHMTCDSMEEAVAETKKHNAEEKKRLAEMKADDPECDHWCYDRAMVTPEAVFKIEVSD